MIARIFLLATLARRLRNDRDGARNPAGTTTMPTAPIERGRGDEPIPPRREGEPGPDDPLDLPASDWKWAAKTTVKEIKSDRVTFIAAGMAYYMFLAIFPALIAGLGILGLANIDPEPIVDSIQSQLPGESGVTLVDVVTSAAGKSREESLAATIVGIGVALWSASSAFVALQSGLNIAFHVPKDRKFFVGRGIAFLLIVSTAALGVGPPVVFALLDLGEGVGFSILRWVVSTIGVILLFSVYYYLGPKRDRPKWQWISPGGITGAVIWIAVSAGFRIYVSGFSSYDKTYGTVATFIVLILWLYLTSIAILVGGELNAQLEQRAEQRSPSVE